MPHPLSRTPEAKGGKKPRPRPEPPGGVEPDDVPYAPAEPTTSMKKGGKIICTDGSEANREKAKVYLKRAKIEKVIDYRVGNALDIIQKTKGKFDIILNDIDKQDYPRAFDLAIPRLRKGGIFITDNVLWSGRILNSKPDKATKAILEFNRKLFNSKDVIASIIPIRDGLGIAVKR